MKIEIVTFDSPHLPAVKKLGKENAATLGFFPEGAFDDHAKKKLIFAAIDENENCLGYLLYRISKSRASITHLCINEKFRRSGAAHALVERLKQDTENLTGISLRCRRDYVANDVWGKFGFVAFSELDGRGKVPKDLVCWWFRQSCPTLFDLSVETLDQRLPVVADANVFFDFNDENRDGFVESNSLRADWLTDFIEICLVNETYNEILRNENREIREKSREFASQLRLFSCQHKEFEVNRKLITDLFFAARSLNKNDESDVAQLAQTVCSGAQYFATRDDKLLALSENFFIHFGVKILRPSDLIILLDEFRREDEYQPAKLSGTLIQTVPLKTAQGEPLDRLFKNFGKGESKVDFQRNIRRFLANPNDYSCFQIIDDSGVELALIVYEKTDPATLKVPIFRIKSGSLSSTLTRNLILKAVNDSYTADKSAIRLEDQRIINEIIDAANECGFLLSDSHLVKFHLRDVLTLTELVSKIKGLPWINSSEERFLLDLSEIANRNNHLVDLEGCALIEKALFPVKVTDCGIPSFIVPIQPQWAMELFDENLAAQSMYGSKKDLALRKEQVFYRSSKNSNGIKAPARILWYVSLGKNSRYYGIKAIKACSMLDEVLIDKPKTLYARFKKLGIYTWKEVYGLADEDINNPIMVLRFSNTQLFKKPIDFSEVESIAQKNGHKMQTASPYPVSSKTFLDIYKKGLLING